MKKIILTSLAAILLATSANAGAYVSGYLKTTTDSEGVSNGNDYKNEVGFLDELDLDVTVGYALSNGVRVEADIFTTGLYKKDVDFGDSFFAQFHVGAVKGIYDFATAGGFTPYVGAGLIDLEYINVSKLATFHVVGVAGVSYALNNKLSLDLQYNRTFYYNSNGENVNNSYNGVNVFKLGAIYKF
ncbi:MAG: outer membrane beta-barrel protein [Rickettsiales bacterium]|jgi:opacity protein-like surface antigen|nr:outer membrane beta-barrel protein [Rickettsiales bacterium]